MTEDRRKILDNMIHIGRGFEVKLAEEIPITYVYSSEDVVSVENKPIWQDVTYHSVTGDMARIPEGMSKFQFLDKSRDKIQSEVIGKIKEDKGECKTFVLTTRPRIEAGTSHYGLYLKGKWVDAEDVKTIQAPEEFEDPFPAE